MLRAVAGRVGGWDYRGAPEGAGKRDLRIDLLRGFCVFVMIVDHIGGETSWLYVLTGGNQFIVSAAEGFVLLSGFSMGMVHHLTIRRSGVGAMLGKVFGRAWLLYLLTVTLTIAFAAVSSLLDTPWAAEATPARSRTDFALSVLTLHRTYSLTDILVLYTLLILSAGPALWLIARGYTGLVLGASSAAWVIAQVWPERVLRAWQITDGGFPFSAWQLVFFIGLMLGYHRQRIATYLMPRYLFTLSLVFAGVLIAMQTLALDLLTFRLAGGASSVHDLLFDKNDARIGRIVALFAAAAFAYAFVTVAWRPIGRLTSWLLMPMGQRALFAYGIQLFVVAFVSSELMAPVRLNRENALFQAASVLVVWTACVLQPALMDRLRATRDRLRGPLPREAG